MSIQSNFPAIKPSLLLDFANTKQLDNRITFTRSTPAVYYDGKTTAMAEQNLLLQSQTFDNGSWTKQAVTVTADSTTAPDGTTTADTLSNSATTAQFWMYQALTLPIGSTLSIFAKAGTANFIGMSSINGNTNAAVFNLSTGAVASSAPDVTASIISVGSGWYRCSIVNNTYAGTYVVVSIQESDLGSGSIGSYTGTGKNIYIWGIQAEARRTLTAYTATTTQPITNYIPVLLSAGGNQARFDHNPTTGESLGLLIEEQRTNFFTYSSQFDNAAWTKVGTTITPDAMVAPDGTLTADAFISSATTAAHYLNLVTPSLTSGTAYTSSFYAKAAGYNFVAVASISISRVANALFDLSLGTVVSTTGTATITSVGNGWYRCTATLTSPSTGSDVLAIALADTNAGGYVPTFTGNGYSGVLLWGAQFEQGAFASSYIATTSASATRTSDDASISGINFSSWWNQNEGTYYIENSYGGFDNQPIALCDLDLTGGNAWVYASGAGVLSTFYASPVSLAINSSVSASMNINYRYATAFSPTGKAVSAANTSAVVSANTANPKPSTGIFIGRYSNGYYINGRIKKIAYYPIRVTNTQLQALTS
jgi:hypothetical protein